MANYSPQKWLEKADWEGGVIDALDYGLSQVDLATEYEGTEFYELVEKAAKLYAQLRILVDEIDNFEEEEN